MKAFLIRTMLVIVSVILLVQLWIFCQSGLVANQSGEHHHDDAD